jgi:hypothetical protein
MGKVRVTPELLDKLEKAFDGANFVYRGTGGLTRKELRTLERQGFLESVRTTAPRRRKPKWVGFPDTISCAYRKKWRP